MGIVNEYHAGIDWILRVSGQSDKFLHVQAGLILWLLAAAVLRRRLGTLAPLFAVILAEVVNECMDRLYAGTWNWPDTIGDAAATWAWPIVLTVVLSIDRRRRPAARRGTTRIRGGAPLRQPGFPIPRYWRPAFWVSVLE